MERTVEIAQHRISYWYDEDQEMTEDDEQHVLECIIAGYNQGELNYLMPDGDTENRGWWKILRD